MSPIFMGVAAVLIICFVVFAAALMKKPSSAGKIAAVIVAVPMLAFSCYGFLATFEGSGGQFLWFRVIYAAIICIVIAGVAANWWPRRQAT